MNKTKLQLIAVLALFAACYCTEYYVSTTGNDNNDCSEATPCRQITQVLKTAVGGDTIHVGAGDFKAFNIDFDTRNFGTAADKPLIVMGTVDDDGVTPLTNIVYDSTKLPSYSARDSVYIGQTDYVHLEGIRACNNPGRCGIRVDRSDHVTVKKSQFCDNLTWGFFANTAQYLHVEDVWTSGSQVEHGFYFADSCKHVTCLRCKATNNARSGIQFNGDSGIEDGINNDILIDSCTSSGNLVGLNLASTKDIVIQNNLIHDITNGGIHLYEGQGGAGAGPKNITIQHNTFHIKAAGYGYPILFIEEQGDIFVYNNLFASQTPDRGYLYLHSSSSATKFHANNNLFIGPSTNSALDVDETTKIDLAGWQTLSSQDSESQTAEPSDTINDWAGRDFSLKEGSPAIGFGVERGVSFDIRGCPRTTVDVGAYAAGTCDTNAPFSVATPTSSSSPSGSNTPQSSNTPGASNTPKSSSALALTPFAALSLLLALF